MAGKIDAKLAELGIVGFAAFAFFMARLAISLCRLYFATTVPYTRLLIGWLTAAFTGILLQSQSEGRLLDEPYLWVLLALILVGVFTSALSVRERWRAEEDCIVRGPE